MKYLLCSGLLTVWFALPAQKSSKPILIKKDFSVTLIPGIGIGGHSPGNRESMISLNLFSGYSFANRGFELSLISAANVADTRGIQLSGIGNITGINYEISPFTQPQGEANLTGIQLAGVVNLVRDYVYGAQISAVYNQGRNLLGMQIGAMNRVDGFGFGNQTGIYNWTGGSFDGLQLGALLNETNGRLVGVQIAPVNIAGSIEGKNTDPEGKLTAVQAGLFNLSGDMHGFQIGLVNISRKMRGTQIGLINISTSGGVPVNKRNGTMIGLINIGTFHTLGISTGEMFYYNLFLETGTLKNGSIRGKRANRYFTSSLEYSFSPTNEPGPDRQFGFGLHKYFYNYTVTPGMNEKRFLQAAFRVHYLHGDGENFDAENLYGGLSAGAGYRLLDKLSLYVTVRADLNYAWTYSPETSILPDWGADLGEGYLWPAWRLGVMLH